jgi:hypothetical protein
MSTKETTRSGGIGVMGLLGVVFVTLKLIGIIAWSWWWVTAPFWLPTAIALGMLLILAIVAGVIALFSKY